MNQYRIRRSDRRNLVIESRTAPEHHRSKAGESWTVVGYYHDPHALASGLMSLVMAGSIPDPDAGLAQQVEDLRQDIDNGIERLISEIEYA